MLLRTAWRSIWRNRRRTLITVSSISLGLMIVIFFIALGDGIYYQLIDDAARMQAGHATIEHPGYRDAPAVDLWIENTGELREDLERVPDVELTKLLVLGQGVARSGRGSVGVAVMGVEPSVEARTSLLAKHVIKGNYLEDSDDTRNTPAASLIATLQAKGASVRIHDPYVQELDFSPLPVEKDIIESVKESDCLALVTKHADYYSLDLEEIKSNMRTLVIVDGRNVFDQDDVLARGFEYRCIGKRGNQ